MDMKEYRITDKKGAFRYYHQMDVQYTDLPNIDTAKDIRIGNEEIHRTVYPNGLIVEMYKDIDDSWVVRTNGAIIEGKKAGEYIFVLPLEPVQK